jgi:ATP-binding cassette subfamily B (MDR/TAP) protein 1
MGSGEILEQGTHNDLLADENGPYAQLVFNQKLSQTAAINIKGPSESDERLDSPHDEKTPGFPDLNRATTGRSLASAAMDHVRARKEEEEAEEDKIPSMWKLYSRLIKINKEDKWLYILGTIGAIANGLVYPALAILFGQALQDFQLDNSLIRGALTEKA